MFCIISQDSLLGFEVIKSGLFSFKSACFWLLGRRRKLNLSYLSNFGEKGEMPVEPITIGTQYGTSES